MNFFKKLTAAVIAAAALISLTACGSRYDDYIVDGGDRITSLREEFAALDSGVLSVYNTETDELQSEFTFLYNKKDVLKFSYKSTQEGEPYYEYYDGKSLNIQRKGEVMTFKWPNPNYKKYKRGKDTHPNASGGIFFYEPACMTLEEDEKTAVVIMTTGETEDCYSYSYDLNRLSEYMATETPEGTVVSFVTDYYYDKSGKFLRMEEICTLDNGTIYSSTVKISCENEIEEIINYIEE